MDAAGASVGAAGETRWARPRWQAALLVAVATLVGLLTLDGGFVYDDRHAILQSPVVQGALPFGEAATGRDFWGLPLGSAAKVSWRPALPLIWRGLWAAGGGSPLPLRAFGLLAHVVACLLGWALLRRWLPARAALLAALAFAVHPVHAEAVGGMVGNADVLAGAAVFGALLWLDRRPQQVTVACAFVGLGCLVKESALLGLPLLAIALWTRRASMRSWLGFVATAGGVATAVLTMVARAHGGAAEGASDNVLVALPTGGRLLTALALVWRGARVLVWPDDVAPNHSYAVYDAAAGALWPWALAGTLVLGGALVTGLRALARHDTATAVLLGLCAGPIVAGSNLLFLAPTEFAERLLYVSALAPAAWAASGLDALLRRNRAAGRRTGAAWLGAAIVLATLATVTVWHQRPWRDQRALFAHGVAIEPRSWRNQHNLGDALAKAGEVESGLWHVLLGAHLRRSLPQPLDWRVVEALELLPVRERLLTGPAALAGPDACGLIEALIAAAWPGEASARDAAQARTVFAQRYDCPGPGSAQASDRRLAPAP